MAEYEGELSWRGWGTIPIRTLSETPPWRAPLPSAFVTFAAKLEQVDALGDDLAVQCSAATARRLTNAMWKRVRELAAEGRITAQLPNTVEELGRVLEPRAVVEIIATVVATGLQFDPKAIGARRSALARAWSMLESSFGKRAIRAAARAASGRRDRVVCLQFATATRVLFYALKRATGAPVHAFVPAIFGAGIDLANPFEQHAWNWLVDGEAGSIAAFDVSTRAARESHDFEIELPRYRNASAFLGSIYGAAIRTSSSSAREDARELVRAMIDPDTVRGQVLLFHLADHVVTPVNVRGWLAARLDACSFRRVVPDFRERLARRDEGLGHLGRMAFTTGDWDLVPFDVL